MVNLGDLDPLCGERMRPQMDIPAQVGNRDKRTKAPSRRDWSFCSFVRRLFDFEKIAVPRKRR